MIKFGDIKGVVTLNIKDKALLTIFFTAFCVTDPGRIRRLSPGSTNFLSPVAHAHVGRCLPLNQLFPLAH
jgi:hypothetical protein